MIYWFTGQPGAGKTTLALALKKKIGGIHIDGDDLRRSLGSKDYSRKGRSHIIQTAQIMAEWLDSFDVNVLVSVLAPYREMRENFKQRTNVTEIYVHTTEARGREKLFADYEPPLESFIDVDTGQSLKMCIDTIVGLPL